VIRSRANARGASEGLGNNSTRSAQQSSEIVTELRSGFAPVAPLSFPTDTRFEQRCHLRSRLAAPPQFNVAVTARGMTEPPGVRLGWILSTSSVSVRGGVRHKDRNVW
jgi:hypothetical protein